MSYLFLVLSFSSFILCSFFVEKLLTGNLKKYCFITSLSMISVLIFYSTFFTNFFNAQLFVYLSSLIILLYELIKNKAHLLKIFFVTNRLFFYFSLIWFVLTINAQILQWDDFSWGSFVKHLNYFGTYWNSDSAILAIGLRYLPGLSLWENFFTGRYFYSEQALFFSLGLICISCFYTLRPAHFTSKQTAWLFVFFCGPISWFSNGIGNISTEAATGFLLGTGLFACYDVKKSKELFVPFIIAVFMGVTKETSFVLALLIILLAVLKSIREKNFMSKWTIYSIITLFIICLNYKFWQFYIFSDPAISKFDGARSMNMFLGDLTILSKRSHETLITFGNALFDRPFGRSYLSRIPIPGFIYLKGFYIFWAICLSILILQVRNLYEYTITFFWGLLGYTLVVLSFYMYLFGDYESTYLASYERYIGLYFLAFSLLAMKIFLENNLWFNKKLRIFVILLFILIPPSPRILYPQSIPTLIPESITNKFKIRVARPRLEVAAIRKNIEETTPPSSRIWLIWQNSTGLQSMIVRYEIVPRKMNIGFWSLGEKYYEGDVWTQDYDNSKVSQIMINDYDYMALGYIDDKFIQKYNNLFASVPKTGSVYKKEFINKKLLLTEVL